MKFLCLQIFVFISDMERTKYLGIFISCKVFLIKPILEIDFFSTFIRLFNLIKRTVSKKNDFQIGANVSLLYRTVRYKKKNDEKFRANKTK